MLYRTQKLTSANPAVEKRRTRIVLVGYEQCGNCKLKKGYEYYGNSEHKMHTKIAVRR